jgi:pimeloyl-ACP methyl ester carboxylesterase
MFSKKIALLHHHFIQTILIMLFITASSQLLADHHEAGQNYGSNPDAGHVAKINGIDMYYESYGEGEPMLIIHGSGQSITDMHYQIAHFSRSYQVIVADSRGHGKSGLGTEALNYVQMMEDWNSLMDMLDLSNANVIGWSDGGIIALLLAIHHPDKVHKMATMGANLRPDDTAIYTWAAEFVAGAIESVDEMIAKGDTSNDWQLMSQHLNMLKTQPNIPIEDVQKIEAPVLVINGDKDVIRNTHAMQIFNNLQKGHLAIMPGQTHFAPITDPEGFNALVEKFMNTPYERPESVDILTQ